MRSLDETDGSSMFKLGNQQGQESKSQTKKGTFYSKDLRNSTLASWFQVPAAALAARRLQSCDSVAVQNTNFVASSWESW